MIRDEAEAIRNLEIRIKLDGNQNMHRIDISWYPNTKNTNELDMDNNFLFIFLNLYLFYGKKKFQILKIIEID